MFKSVNGGKLPTKGSKYSACVDLYANEDVTIGAGETKLIPLGVAIDKNQLIEAVAPLHREHWHRTGNFKCFKDYYEKFFLDSHYLQLMLRSSLSKELIIANGVGVVDLDYPGEIMVRVHKPITLKNCLLYIQSFFTRTTLKSEVLTYKIKKGDRVAQITLLKHEGYLFGIESDAEREGGFGSTGK